MGSKERPIAKTQLRISSSLELYCFAAMQGLKRLLDLTDFSRPDDNPQR